jgi:hypothetical protein
MPGSRYAPEFGVGLAVAKYADHLPLERQVKMMAREGLTVDSQTLWDQLHALARHLEPTYDALARRVLEASVINVDETRWPIMGSLTPAKGTVWGVRSPTVSFYRILPGKSAEEGRQVLHGYAGTVVADGFPLQLVTLTSQRVAFAFRFLGTLAPIGVVRRSPSSGFGASGTPQLCQNSSPSTRPANQLPTFLPADSCSSRASRNTSIGCAPMILRVARTV